MIRHDQVLVTKRHQIRFHKFDLKHARISPDAEAKFNLVGAVS